MTQPAFDMDIPHSWQIQHGFYAAMGGGVANDARDEELGGLLARL